MAENLNQELGATLPEGFTLDTEEVLSAKLPPGFTLDTPSVVAGELPDVSQIPVTAEGLPLTPEQEAQEEQARIGRKEEAVFEDPGILREAEQTFSAIVGERVGIDPGNLLEFRKSLGFLAPVVEAGATVLEGVAGGIGVGISLAADVLGELGVPDSDKLKRDLLALTLETPIVGQAGAAKPPIPRPSVPRLPSVKIGETVGRGVTKVNELIDRVFPPSKKAEDLLGDILKLDKIEPENIAIQAANFETRNARKPTLLELGGENVEGLARKVGGEIGESRTVIQNFRNTVLDNQTQLVKDIAERTLVQPNRDFFGDITALEKQMQRTAAPLYKEAFKQTVKINDDIRQMLSTPAGKTAIENASKILRQERIDPATLGITKTKKGFKIDDDVSIEALDAIKRGFDDVLDTFRDKTTGKLELDQFGNAVNKTLKDYRAALDELSPVYAEARAAFAGPASLKNALLDARNAAKKPSITAEVITKQMKGLTPSEREFYRSGFMRGIIDIMEGGVKDANRVRKLVRSETLVKKLEVVFDNKALAKDFVDQLREAEKLSGRVQRVSPTVGTTTTQRASDIAAIGAMSKTGALTNIVRVGFDKLRQNRNIRNEQLVNKDIAELLTQPLTDDIIEQISKRLQEKK